MKKKQKNNNFLLFVPSINPSMQCKTDDNHNIVLTVHHTGLINKLAQVLFFQPKQSYLHMDQLGSFVWRQIDGTANISQIADNVYKQFGEKAEPIFDRLVPFLRTLQRNGFIRIDNPQKNAK